MKGLKAESLGVLFHHFLKMTTESRWRNSGVVGEQQTVTPTQRAGGSAVSSLCYCSDSVQLWGRPALSRRCSVLSLNPDYNFRRFFEYILNFINEKEL